MQRLNAIGQINKNVTAEPEGSHLPISEPNNEQEHWLISLSSHPQNLSR